jgi:poly(3-hydroxybutyrate) depolymerase
MRQHLLQEGVGHYGIFSGNKFRTLIYPQIKAFFDQH